MVARLRPTDWYSNPVECSARIAQLFLSLLDESRPGQCGLWEPGTPDSWLSGPEAQTHVHDAHDQTWTSAADAIYRRTNSPHDVFESQLRADSLHVAFDRLRLHSVLDRSSESASSVYFTIRARWFRLNGRILWIPELYLSNYLPESRELAPEPRAKGEDPPSRGAREAGKELEQLLFREADDDLDDLFSKCNLDEARARFVPELVPEGAGLPYLYLAIPDQEWPATPNDALRDGWLTRLQELADETLMTPDILSEDVAGSALSGALVVLRREFPSIERGYPSYYLAVPWGPRSPGADRIEEKLAESSWTLGALHLQYISEVTGLNDELRISVDHIGQLVALVRTYGELSEKIHRLVALNDPGSRARADAYELFGRLRGTFLSTSNRVRSLTNQALGQERSWHSLVQTSKSQAEDYLSIRSLDDVHAGLEAIENLGPFRFSRDPVRESSDVARQARDEFVSTEGSVGAMVEAEREDARVRQEQNTRRIGYGLAVVALVAVAPVLLGEYDWPALRGEIRTWGGPVRWLGELLVDVQSELLQATLGIAALGVAALVTVLGYMSATWVLRAARETRAGAWVGRRHPVRTRSARLRRARALLSEMWGALEQAQELTGELDKRNVLFAGSPFIGDPPDKRSTPEPEEAKLLSQLASLDRDAALCLASLFEELSALRPRPAERVWSVHDLRHSIDYFALIQEVMVTRPLWQACPPLVGCIHHLQSPRLWGLSILNEAELRRILRRYGIEVPSVIGNKAALTADAPRACLERLQELSVCASVQAKAGSEVAG